MANGLFGKARTLVLSNLHALLDAAIDLNSIPALEQHLRDLKDARDEVIRETASAKASLKLAEREAEQLETKAKTTDENIELLLGDDDPSNDHHAIKLQVKLDQLQEELAQKQEDIVTARTVAEQMEQAQSQIQSKLEEADDNLQRLKRASRAAAAKQNAADALNRAASLAGVDGPRVDDIARRVEEQNAAADAELSVAMSGISDGAEDSVAIAKAKARIAERRAANTAAAEAPVS